MSSSGLDIDEEFDTGLADDPDRVVDSEALGARHRRRFGYSAAGAEDNDYDILSQGRAPLRIDGPRRQQNVGESRTLHFRHGLMTVHKHNV